MGAKDDEKQYIWISKWKKFQHYQSQRDRAPRWIKDYTDQLNDERYLTLTDRQRALLQDLRRMHAMNRLCTRCDQAVISRHRHMRTRYADIEALNHAGFIEIVSREALEELYSKSRAEVEVEVDSTTRAVEKGRSGPNGLKARGSINKKLRGT